MSFAPPSTTGPTLAPQGSFQLSLNGVAVGDFDIINDIVKKSLTKEHEIIPQNLRGVPVRRVSEEGIEVTFTCTRQTSKLEMLHSALLRSFQNSAIPNLFTGYERIQESDGITLTERNYLLGTVAVGDIGKWSSSAPVDGQTLTVKFSMIDEINATQNPFDSITSQGAGL
jgi:hypothetical protein